MSFDDLLNSKSKLPKRVTYKPQEKPEPVVKSKPPQQKPKRDKELISIQSQLNALLNRVQHINKELERWDVVTENFRQRFERIDAEITRDEPIEKYRPTFDQFKAYIFDNKYKGTHYSTYANQKTKHGKDTDIKNFYMILLDLIDESLV